MLANLALYLTVAYHQSSPISTFQAYTVLGQYLVLKKNSDLFKEWMKETCSATSKNSGDTYQCLNDWCEEFL